MFKSLAKVLRDRFWLDLDGIFRLGFLTNGLSTVASVSLFLGSKLSILDSSWICFLQ
jgi:hypothetical protein